MTSHIDEPDQSNPAAEPALDDAAASWRTIFAACTALPPEDPAWDSVRDFISVVESLASVRLAERARIERARQEAVARARERLTSVAAVLRDAPQPNHVISEIERVLAGAIVYDRAAAIAEFATIVETSVADVAALRAQAVERLQAGASAAEMQTYVHELREREVELANRIDDLARLFEPVASAASSGGGTAVAETAPVSDEPSKEDSPGPDESVEEEAPPSVGFGLSAERWPAVEPVSGGAAAAPAEAAAPGPSHGWLSREDAKARYTEPVAALTAPGALTGYASSIAALWSEHELKKSGNRDRLRRHFYEVTAGGAIGASVGHVESKLIRIDLDELRALVAREGADGKALASLDGFDSIAIASAPLAEGLSPTAFVRNLLELTTPERAGRAIRVFLAPHLPASHREETMRKFRSGSMAAAVLDDVDACRLLVPGGKAPFGLESLLRLIAVIAEQLAERA